MARRHTIHQAPHTRAPFYGEMIHMQINKVAFIGKGGVGLLYGSMIAQALGNDAVEYVMDDARFERHAGDALTVNGKPCALKSVRASEATPVDLVILTVKTTGLDVALKTLESVVGPDTLIASLCNGITSEQKIAERFGWEHTVLGICQGMDAVFLNGELTFTNTGEIRFGAAAGTDPAAITAIDELYTRCGIAHTVESDIAHRMWAKLMLNDGINQTCMAYGGTYGSATEPGSEQRRCLVSAMRETLAVANAEGVELTEADLTQMAHLIEGIDPAGMPSMAQDRVARRKTEVEEFAGTICRLAAKHDIQAPQNEWLYQRIRDIEASWWRPTHHVNRLNSKAAARALPLRRLSSSSITSSRCPDGQSCDSEAWPSSSRQRTTPALPSSAAAISAPTTIGAAPHDPCMPAMSAAVGPRQPSTNATTATAMSRAFTRPLPPRERPYFS